MLGTLIMKPSWRWAAVGKHPSAMDYLQLGPNETLIQTFANWIEDGFQKLVYHEKKEGRFHSWRFWVPGKRKGTIACGIGRNSSDRLGRPYPLIIIGMGSIPGWEDHWELLPIIFDDTWSRMEYLAAARLNDLKELEKEINQINRPNLKEVLDTGQIPDYDITSLSDAIKISANDLLRDSEFYASINDNSDHNAFSIVMQWHRGLKGYLKTYPGIVMMGGTPEKSYLAAFNRSLNANDFLKLWTI